MSVPLYRRGDTVYLRESAELGKLESYKISSIKQLNKNEWLYQIDIYKKPPHQLLIGDTFDSRTGEPSLLYKESELVDVCEALDIICTKFKSKIEILEAKVSSKCPEEPKNTQLDEPKWNIGDEVYFVASAKLGFLHSDKIKSIYETAIQPGSRRIKYLYQVENVPNKMIFFREEELASFCTAANMALDTNRKDLTDAENKRSNLCIGI